MNMPPGAMAPSSRNPDKNLSKPQADAVAELRFRVKLGSLTIGRFRECTGIAVEVETKDYMEGGNNDWVHKLPTRISTPTWCSSAGSRTNPRCSTGSTPAT